MHHALVRREAWQGRFEVHRGRGHSRYLTEDVNDHLVTADEAQRDPEIRMALEAWKKGNDRVRIWQRVKWAIAEREGSLYDAHEELHTVVMEAEAANAELDDVYVTSVIELDKLLERAVEILDGLKEDQPAKV
jgi:hypothetical protein